MPVSIRSATPDDADLVFRFIRELAVYERLEHEVVGTAQSVQEHLFGPNPKVFALIAEEQERPIGFALYFYSYSTFLTRHGIYLEDLYVVPEARGKGAGKALLQRIAQIAVAEGCGRFEWSVLDWNEPSIRFYESLGAVPKSEWIRYQLAGEALQSFGGA